MNATPHAKLAPPTPAARCTSAAGRLFPATRGMLRSLTLLLAFAVTAAVPSAAQYLFVPGHGLTDRSGPDKTIIQLRDECKATGIWMRFIEKEYEWGSLEDDLPSSANKDNPSSTERRWNQAGLDQIRRDAEECGKAGLVLRVVLLHKYGSYPAYMTAGNRHTYTFNAGQGTGDIKYEIKLDQGKTKNLLLGLYDKVIAELKSTYNARKGFYGFVIQETSLGSSSYYEGDTNWTQAQNDAAAVRQTAWYANLRAFHRSLGLKLANFNTVDLVTPQGRLFWQMINSPYPEVKKIVDNFNGVAGEGPVIAGAGFCGPDTFPREPANQRPDQNDGTPSRTSIYKCYDEFMRNRTDRPISLRVASSNYYTDRAHFSQLVVRGIQPLYATTNLGSSNGWNSSTNTNDTAGITYVKQGNRDAGDGIANFVGCAKASDNPNDSDSPHNLNLHNVVWTWDEITVHPHNATPPADLTPEQLENWMDRKASNASQLSGPCGWPQVKTWMKNTPNQFIQGATGGCNQRATRIGAFGPAS